MGTKDLIDAIESGNAEGIENTFGSVMSTKVGEKLDTLKKNYAANIFKSSEEQDEIAGEPEVEPAEQPEVEEPAEDAKEI